ncbi:MAG: V-type ATP synthase subunit D [Firmicutes bacterium]|nr:V-type ATP synthase subunit D [Bacillota bacterium]
MKQQVTPTRLELQQQKTRLKTTKRGHKLLKDKSDEMIRNFMLLAKKNWDIREEAEAEIEEALKHFYLARAYMSTMQIENAVSSSKMTVEFDVSSTNIMGTHVPKFTFKENKQEKESGFSHSIINTTANFDTAIIKILKAMEKIIALAEVEKTCDMLSEEIIRIRRRMNALEFIVMPEIKANIRMITLKLAEAERASKIQLMKLKGMKKA